MTETVEEMRARRRREAYLRVTGRPMLVRGNSHEAVVKKVRAYHLRGMSYVQMHKQTGISARTICQVSILPRSGIKRGTLNALARMTFEEPPEHARVNPLGTQRRIGGLWAEGWPLPFIAELLDRGNLNHFQKLVSGTRSTTAVTAGMRLAVEELCEKLARNTPDDLGVEPRKVKFAKVFAAKKGIPPLSCWDPDTIIDPDALPEWTGECGTKNGYMIHEREGIPLCEPCKLAGAPTGKFSGDKLRVIRMRRGLSLCELERRLGLKKGHAHHWENNRYAPRREVLHRLLLVLDVTFDEVME